MFYNNNFDARHDLVSKSYCTEDTPTVILLSVLQNGGEDIRVDAERNTRFKVAAVKGSLVILSHRQISHTKVHTKIGSGHDP